MTMLHKKPGHKYMGTFQGRLWRRQQENNTSWEMRAHRSVSGALVLPA